MRRFGRRCRSPGESSARRRTPTLQVRRHDAGVLRRRRRWRLIEDVRQPAGRRGARRGLGRLVRRHLRAACLAGQWRGPQPAHRVRHVRRHLAGVSAGISAACPPACPACLLLDQRVDALVLGEVADAVLELVAQRRHGVVDRLSRIRPEPLEQSLEVGAQLRRIGRIGPVRERQLVIRSRSCMRTALELGIREQVGRAGGRRRARWAGVHHRGRTARAPPSVEAAACPVHRGAGAAPDATVRCASVAPGELAPPNEGPPTDGPPNDGPPDRRTGRSRNRRRAASNASSESDRARPPPRRTAPRRARWRTAPPPRRSSRRRLVRRPRAVPPSHHCW